MPNAHDERHHAQLTGTRRSLTERLRRVLGPYVLIAPAAGFIGVIFLYSLVRLGYASLHTGDNGNTGPAQLDAYRFVLNDEIFRTAVKHNLLLLISVPVVLVLALAHRADPARGHHGLAHLPDDRVRALHPRDPGARHDVHLPAQPRRRAQLRCSRDVGLGFLAQDWFGSPSWVLPSIAAIIIYHELGFGVVLFLARLLSLPEEVDQAARIDGCNWWQLRRQITLPQMTGVITAFVTLELINMLSWVFAYVYSTTKGGPELRELRDRALHLRQRVHVPGSELRGRGGDPAARRQHRADRRAGAAHVDRGEP